MTDEVVTYTDEERAEGLTKARLRCNLDREEADRFKTNKAYAAWVCKMAGIDELPAEALDSYAAQHADKSVSKMYDDIANKDKPADAAAEGA